MHAFLAGGFKRMEEDEEPKQLAHLENELGLHVGNHKHLVSTEEGTELLRALELGHLKDPLKVVLNRKSSHDSQSQVQLNVAALHSQSSLTGRAATDLARLISS
jgi:hypothetical protein